MSNANWYVYCGTQRTGPHGLEEIRRMHRAGQLTASHLLWRPGVTKPEPVGRFPEILAQQDSRPTSMPLSPPHQPAPRSQAQTHSPPPALAADDRSLLIGVRPRAVDDTTSSLDPRELRRAEKEARRAQGRENRARVSLVTWAVRLLALATVGGAGYGAYRLHSLGPEKLAALLSPIPDLEGVSATDLSALRSAAKGPVGTVAGALATLNTRVLHLAVAQADGSKLKLRFFPLDSRSPASFKQMEIELPVKRRLSTLELDNTARPVPPGRYRLEVFGDDPARRDALAQFTLDLGPAGTHHAVIHRKE